LLHVDSKRFVRFSRPGHAVTGDRYRSSTEKRMRIGYEWVHSVVDDHSRFADSELHRNERAETITGFVGAGAGALQRARDRTEAAALRQRLRLPAKPLASRAAASPRDRTTQLTRRPATDQPRPQPPEAGHLGARACSGADAF